MAGELTAPAPASTLPPLVELLDQALLAELDPFYLLGALVEHARALARAESWEAVHAAESITREQLAGALRNGWAG
jgi:hypothetical protein